MANFMPFTSARLPETTVDDLDEARRLFRRVFELELPGFVIRQAWLEPVHDRELALDLSDGTMTIGPCSSLMSSLITIDDADFGPHRDVPPIMQLDEERTINAHTTNLGAADVHMFLARASAKTFKLPLIDEQTEEDELHREQYAKGHIDGSLFIPVRHETTVEAGDSVVFNDWRTIHNFITTAHPRAYASGLYIARRSVVAGG